MNFIDIIILVPVAWFAFSGFRKGLIIEVATLVGLFIGIYAGVYFSDFVSGLLVSWFGFSSKYSSIISFTIVFIGIIILMYILAKAIEKVVNLTALGVFNKIAGAFFGAIKMLLILSLLIHVFNKIDDHQTILKKETREKSLLYIPISKIALIVIPKLSEVSLPEINNDTTELKTKK
jgi:membrane protein required for colicin V production